MICGVKIVKLFLIGEHYKLQNMRIIQIIKIFFNNNKYPNNKKKI